MRPLTNSDLEERIAEARRLMPFFFEQDDDLEPLVSSETYLFYPGSKAHVLSALSPLVPFGLERLLEPFCGSGAFTTAFGPRFVHVECGDANGDLMNAHTLAATAPDFFIETLLPHFGPETNNAEFFYTLREKYRAGGLDQIQRAVALVWLNLRAFRGLMRYSSKGYSASFDTSRPDDLDESEIRAFAERLGNACFRGGDFREMCEDAGDGDLLYLDPPYLPLDGKSDKENFSGYHGKFTERDHIDLARMAAEARDRGAYVLLSNHDSKLARKLYSDADLIKPVMVKRSIGRGNEKPAETRAKEIIVAWEPSRKADPPASLSLPYLTGKSRARAVVEAVRRGADMPGIDDPEEVMEALKLTETALGKARARLRQRAMSEIARIAKSEGFSREDFR